MTTEPFQPKVIDPPELHLHLERALDHAWVVHTVVDVISAREIKESYDNWYNRGHPWKPETQALMDCVDALKRALPFLQVAAQALQVRQQMLDATGQQEGGQSS